MELATRGMRAVALNDKVARLREERIKAGRPPVSEALQGVSKVRIKQVLAAIDLGGNADLVDGVFALMDDESPNFFSKPPEGASFADGATTAHLACHIGILQRGKSKLDREGRDYWIKPLRELGGIEECLLFEGAFIAGHPIAKSPNSSYRLAEDFKAILRASDPQWPEMLKAWASEDAARQRREFQAQMAELSRLLVDTGHSDLIRAAVEYYAPRFLPGFQVVYVDDGDGDRITAEDRGRLALAGIDLKLGDAMPDVLLWNSQTDRLWIIEAVTSDGEVDLHKVSQLRALAERFGKAGVDFTTAYRTWKEAAARQGAHQNIAVGTYIWIQGDPAKQLRVGSFDE